MQTSKVVPLLNVRDCAASIAFYRRLDFEIVSSWPEEGGARFALLRCGDVEMMLNQPSEALAPRGAEPYSGPILFFRVASAPSLWAELRDKGLQPRPPSRESYGFDEMLLSDPDGYWLAFSSPAPAP